MMRSSLARTRAVVRPASVFVSLVILAILASGCASRSTRPVSTPSQVGLLSTYPEVLDAAMTANGGNGSLVLYGGHPFTSRQTQTFDTWLWNGRLWEKHVQANGPQLSSPSIGYEPRRGQLLLVGIGDGYPSKLETWKWTDRGWNQLHPATAPPTYFAVSALVPFNSGLLLYLLRPIARGAPEVTYDMWYWDGKDWHLQSTSYRTPDRPLQHFVPLPGGGAGDLTGFATGADALATTSIARWTGSSWDQHPVSNGPGMIAAATIDPVTGDLLVLGSRYVSMGDFAPPVDSTFLFDGKGWKSTPLPGELNGKVGMEVAGYPALPGVALWGGSQGYGNAGPPHPDPFQAAMWYWNGQVWTRVARAAGVGG